MGEPSAPRAPDQPGPRRRRRVLLTPRDRELLEFAAEHRLILPAHAAVLLRVSPSTATARLRALSQAGYLDRRRVFAGQPAAHQINRNGLRVIDSPLPAPRIDLSAYAHDVGLAWVHLAARAGTFGRVRDVVSERTMRSADGRRQRNGAGGPEERTFGVRLGGRGPRGEPRLHYPDLLLVTPEGQRIAIELELSGKGRARRDQILAGYGSDPGIAAVLYLVDRPVLANAIRSSARRLGISAHVHVQRVRQPGRSGGRDAPVSERRPSMRAPEPGAHPSPTPRAPER